MRYMLCRQRTVLGSILLGQQWNTRGWDADTNRRMFLVKRVTLGTEVSRNIKRAPVHVAALWGPMKFIQVLKSRKSVIWGVWAAPGVPEPHQEVGGRGPPPNEMAPEAPGAAQIPKMTDVPLINIPSHSASTSIDSSKHPSCSIAKAPPNHISTKATATATDM